MMAKISVVLITYNEEANIDRCLRSVSWADEIIVVDSFSTDRTVELAKRYTSNVISHEFDGDIPQRERGFELATGDWLFYIDADEEVSEGLRNEVLEAIRSPDAKDGYLVPRKVWAFGKWIQHGGWFPDHTLRLFRNGSYVPEPAEVHGGFAVRGEKGMLKGFLHHYSYENIEQYLEKMNRYTSLQVSNKLRASSSSGWAKIVFSPLSHFLRKFFSQRGYKDGFHGCVLAVLGAIYTLSLYSKLWEFRFREREGKGNLPPVTNIQLKRLPR